MAAKRTANLTSADVDTLHNWRRFVCGHCEQFKRRIHRIEQREGLDRNQLLDAATMQLGKELLERDRKFRGPWERPQ